jgi:hypothetical protein
MHPDIHERNEDNWIEKQEKKTHIHREIQQFDNHSSLMKKNTTCSCSRKLNLFSATAPFPMMNF